MLQGGCAIGLGEDFTTFLDLPVFPLLVLFFKKSVLCLADLDTRIHTQAGCECGVLQS